MSQEQKLQDKKQAIELQNKYLETRKLYNQVETTIQLNKREKRKGLATQTELEQLPESTRTFKAVGRMFLLTPLNVLKEELTKQIHDCDNEIKSLEARAEVLEKQLRDYESQIREMLKQPQFAQYFA